MRALGHRMLDDLFDHIETLRDRPVWEPLPDEIIERFQLPLPRDGKSLGQVYEDFQQNVMKYSTGNLHPRFWGWVMGNGTPVGLLADMLASGLNPNMGGGETAPNHLEHQVLKWCREMFEFPAGASGVLVSGGSMANLLGLAVGRHARSGFDIRSNGLIGAPPLVFYGSSEMHSSLQKGIELLGLGSNHLRPIPVDDHFHLDMRALASSVAQDRQAGFKPIGVIGCAGTVNTGAIDPLEELAEFARSQELWFHIDGAFGALAYLSPTLRPRLVGLPKADSLAFDLHKWFYLPFEIGCVLVRDEEVHRHAFALHPDYLQHATRGLAGGPPWLSDYSLQLTRGFRALKAWMALETHGVDLIARMIRKNVQQAEYLAEVVQEAPDFELLAPVDLNVVCFRFTGGSPDPASIDDLNEEILFRLQESGAAVPSSTKINGEFALRCAITNHRSQREDFDFLVAETRRLGKKVLAEA